MASTRHAEGAAGPARGDNEADVATDRVGVRLSDPELHPFTRRAQQCFAHFAEERGSFRFGHG